MVARGHGSSSVAAKAPVEVGRARSEDGGHGDPTREGDVGSAARATTLEREDVAGPGEHAHVGRHGPGPEIGAFEARPEVGPCDREGGGLQETKGGTRDRAFERGREVGIAHRAVRAAVSVRIEGPSARPRRSAGIRAGAPPERW